MMRIIWGVLNSTPARRHGTSKWGLVDGDKCLSHKLVQIGNSRAPWAQHYRPALRKAYGFPANVTGAFLLRGSWKAST